MSHKGAILVKALGGGICVLWTHFFSSVISVLHNAFLSAKLVWLPVEGGGVTGGGLGMHNPLQSL